MRLPAKTIPSAVVLIAAIDRVSTVLVSATVKPSAQGLEFAASQDVWQIVRENSNSTARIVTIRITSRRLLHGRSTFPGLSSPIADPAIPVRTLPSFAPLCRPQRSGAATLFSGLFSGDATSKDIDEIASTFDCTLIVFAPGDGA
jgi:hypothetical protein